MNKHDNEFNFVESLAAGFGLIFILYVCIAICFVIVAGLMFIANTSGIISLILLFSFAFLFLIPAIIFWLIVDNKELKKTLPNRTQK